MREYADIIMGMTTPRLVELYIYLTCIVTEKVQYVEVLIIEIFNHNNQNIVQGKTLTCVCIKNFGFSCCFLLSNVINYSYKEHILLTKFFHRWTNEK